MIVMIDDVLKKRNRTRYWLAKKTGIRYANISKLADNKTTSVKFRLIDDICNALECEIEDILKTTKSSDQLK